MKIELQGPALKRDNIYPSYSQDLQLVIASSSRTTNMIRYLHVHLIALLLHICLNFSKSTLSNKSIVARHLSACKYSALISDLAYDKKG